MEASHRETEIKIRFPSLEAAAKCLRAAGAQPLRDREREDNVLYDRATSTLQGEGKALRLRRTASGSLLTLKIPVPGERAHKVRIEHETSVGHPEAMARILRDLGFSPAYRYQKYRSLFRLDQVEVCLDETPLGCFVELEGEPDAIDRLARRLGFGPEDYIRDSYRKLHLDAIAAGSAPPGDLLLPDEETGAPR
jgi:adenylate cyclase class 2